MKKDERIREENEDNNDRKGNENRENPTTTAGVVCTLRFLIVPLSRFAVMPAPRAQPLVQPCSPSFAPALLERSRSPPTRTLQRIVVE
jgi:hypothetical protein